MKKLFFLMISICCLQIWSPANPGNDQGTDLLFLVSFSNYDDWIQEGFNADKSRRSNYCNEAKTGVAKINDQHSLVWLEDFDMSRMGEFAGDPEMAEIMKRLNVQHTEMYQAFDINGSMKATGDMLNLLIKVETDDFDKWLKTVFSEVNTVDTELFDATKTKIGKVDKGNGWIILYNFNLDGLWSLELSDKSSRSKSASTQIFLLNPMG